MKFNTSKFKSHFFGNVLKLLGVCGILLMFEACYGTPKAAYAPNTKKSNSNEQVEKNKVKMGDSTFQKEKN